MSLLIIIDLLNKYGYLHFVCIEEYTARSGMRHEKQDIITRLALIQKLRSLKRRSLRIAFLSIITDTETGLDKQG